MSEPRTMGPDPNQKTVRLWGGRVGMPGVVKAVLQQAIIAREATLADPPVEANGRPMGGNAMAHFKNRVHDEIKALQEYLKAAA